MNPPAPTVHPEAESEGSGQTDPTHWCWKCRTDVDAQHVHKNWLVGIGAFALLGGIATLAVCAVVVFVVNDVGTWIDNTAERNERDDLQHCRVEQYIAAATGRTPLDGVDIAMRTRDGRVQVTADGLVIDPNVNPLDVFAAADDECTEILSDKFIDEPDNRECAIRQYLLESIPADRRIAALPADLDVDARNKDGVNEITVNGYVAATNVEALRLVTEHPDCGQSTDR